MVERQFQVVERQTQVVERRSGPFRLNLTTDGTIKCYDASDSKSSQNSHKIHKIDIRVLPVTSVRVTVSDTARDLGVIINSRLTMADHVAAVCRSCYYQLRQLRSVTRSLSVEAVKAVVHTFISSCLDYCNSLLTGVNDDLLWRL